MIKQDYKPPKDAPYEVRWIIRPFKHLRILQTYDLEYARRVVKNTRDNSKNDVYIWDRMNNQRIS